MTAANANPSSVDTREAELRGLAHLAQRLRLYCGLFGPRGLLLALEAKFRRRPRLVRVAVRFARHPVYLRLKTSDVPVFRQVFADGEYALDWRQEPKTIVDAGANIGLTSVYFANRFPSARILALEPERANYALLEKNVAPYPGIVPLNAALWWHRTELDLVDPGEGAWAFQTVAGARRSGQAAKASVPALPLEELLSKHGLDEVDLLKVDIEGAEREVFEHASNWIDRVRAMVIEVHDVFKPGCAAAVHAATPGFDVRFTQGESLVLARGDILRRKPEG